ncbi:caspase family protein [Blastopirellula sp. JC732]|uniref:Caspase family protein n=1 Tax=Blastopirellula sediminis TaxID=2894196 RepID=A0A9X1SEV7_9BACT|nr:caspase family protein [Blastopirellula sediminis]MCC9608241.1 caspase family protein [Blastopirellula sediminis]MCC9626966.1 caspase family protein [Blastopirellula sediminis]
MDRIRSLLTILAIIVGCDNFVGFAAAGEAAYESVQSVMPQLVIDPKGLTGEPVVSVSMSDDGQYVAAASGKQVVVWDLQTGQLITTLRGYREPGGFSSGTINVVRFMPNSHHLLVAVTDNSEFGSTRVYDLTNPNEIHQLIEGHLGCTQNLAISPSGQTLATTGCDGMLYVLRWDRDRERWQPNRNFVYGSLEGIPAPFDEKHGPRYSLRPNFIMPLDDDWIMWTSPTECSMISTETGRIEQHFDNWPNAAHNLMHLMSRQQLPGVGGAASASDFAIGSAYWTAMAGTSDNSNFWAAVWKEDSDLPATVYRKHRIDPTSIDYNPRTGLVASGDAFGEVHIWDARTGAQFKRLRPENKQLYRADWSDDGKTLLLADSFYSDPSRYHFNHFGPVSLAFDLETRRFRDAAPVPDKAEAIDIVDPKSGGPASVLSSLRNSPDAPADTRDLTLKVNDKRYNLNPHLLPDPVRNQILGTRLFRESEFGSPWSYAANPHSGQGGGPHSIIVGSKTGQVMQFEIAPVKGTGPPVMLVIRKFVGHTGAVTSVAISPDGTRLATSSWDGTIRLWKLGPIAPQGDVDFASDGSSVTNVPPASEAARAGIIARDVIVKFNDGSFFERNYLFTQDSLLPGAEVDLKIARKSDPLSPWKVMTKTIRLSPAPEIVEPYLTLFLDRHGEWVGYTPRGYFDGTPQGQQYVGWHLNRARHQTAEFYAVGQFDQLYRPDIVRETIRLADESEAIQLANGELREMPNPPDDNLDFRNRDTVEAHRPPEVAVSHKPLPPNGGRYSVLVETRVATAVDKPVKKIDVRSNGQPVLVLPIDEHEQVVGNQRIRVLTHEVPLPTRENVITVEAIGESTQTTERREINIKPAEVMNDETPNLYILAIGISEYQNPSLKLQFAHKDAIDFANAWRRYEGQHYSKVISKVLVDEEATTNNIRDAMDWLSRSVRPHKDLAFVFLAGHAVYERRAGWFFGAVNLDRDRLRATGIGHDELTGWLDDELPCDKILFTDTCHATKAVREMGFLPRHPQEKDIWRETNTLVIASCNDDQESVESNLWENGAFTEAMLEALSGSVADYDGDFWISLKEISVYLDNKVPNLASELGIVQHPSMKNRLGIGKLVLAPVVIP